MCRCVDVRMCSADYVYVFSDELASTHFKA